MTVTTAMQKEISRFYPDNCPMALFLDLDNLCRYDCDFKALLEALSPWGRLVVRRACGVHLGSKLRLCERLHQHDFQILEAGAGPKKNRTDMRLIMEMMEILHRRPEVKTFVLCSGDGDFIEAIRCLHDNRKAVIGIASKDSCSKALVDACDRFLFIEDMFFSLAPAKNEALAHGSTRVRTSPESMRTWLRHCGFLPPEPTGRRQILQVLARLTPMLKTTAHTYRALQERLAELCVPLGLSKNAVRHVLISLLKSQTLRLADDGQPLLERKVETIADTATMEKAVGKAQLCCLLSCPDLVADPIALAEVIWDEPQRAPEMEKWVDELAAQTRKA